MENEILWKWELLCNEFEVAKLNYINIYSPLFDSFSAGLDGTDKDEVAAQLECAKVAWTSWVEIQNQVKKFVEENTQN